MKNRELQKNLFDYIGAGTVSPKFLIKKLYDEENTKLEIDFINLDKILQKKEAFSEEELKIFLDDNKEQLNIEYLDFKYAIINPKILIGSDEFNQSFFDKIDEIEIDIANDVAYENIIENFDIPSINKTNFKISSKSNEIEKKIFELRNNEFDIFEIEDDFIIYKILGINKKQPDLEDDETRIEILELISQRERFDYNRNLLKEINDGNFDNNRFLEMGQNQIQKTKLNSVKDNKKFKIDAVKILYSLPENSFTLINDEKNNIYLAKVKKFLINQNDNNEDQIKEYLSKQNSNMKNSILKSYDLYLNSKYSVELNQKTVERVKNFFQ